MNLNLTQLVICDESIVGYGHQILTDSMKLKILERRRN